MNDQRGFALAGFLIMAMIGAILIASALKLATIDARSDRAIEDRPAVYYSVEDSLGRALGWLRANAAGMSSGFGRSRFYDSFTRITAPAIGDNDPASLVPSKLRVAGTGSAPILSNSADLGTSAFPVSVSPAFDPATSFASADLGANLVRITLLDAIALDPSKDYGEGSAPGTDFAPIYRIDVMTASDRGAHIYAIVTGEPESGSDGAILIGEDVTIEGECDSYRSSDGAYGGQNRLPGCHLQAKRDITIARHGTVYGSAAAKGALTIDGRLCGDGRSCNVSGTTCSGSSCPVPDLPQAATWDTACPSDRGDLRVTGTATLIPASGAPGDSCWGDVSIASNGRLNLTSDIPYHFKSLRFEGGWRSEIGIAPAGGTVVLNVYGAPDALWDARSFDAPANPSSFELNYLGSTPLGLERDRFYGRVFAPSAYLSLERNIDLYGSISALGLTVERQAGLHLDENGTGGLSGMRHRLRQVVQANR